jgi:hypothetical protein
MPKIQVIQEYEELDRLRCLATAFAESKCRKLHTGQVAFSPELNAARLKIKVWLLLVSKAKGRKVSSRLISRSIKKANMNQEVKLFYEETLQEQLKLACLDVMILKKSGVTDLSGLRTIILFPVDCNYAFKHVGREMMKVAEATKALAPEQYGSR